MLNSLSQSLTALPAPSGREPLAKPEALRLNRRLCRYAKGPISEGAVAEGDWGSLLPGIPPFRLAASRQATFPKGTAELPQSKPDGFASSLWEGASGETGGFAILSVTFPLCQGLSLWERWMRT